MTGKNLSRSLHTAPNNTNLPHNNREEEEVKKKKSAHIDKERIKDNVYLIQEPIEEKYEEIFGESQERYNKTQKRNDRKIENYYEKVKAHKLTQPQREMIVQFGSVEDIESGKITAEELKEMLLEYHEHFQERNPNLVLYNAVLHMDEATPHLHLNYIPVATDYKRGMDTQVSLNKALAQQNESFNQSRPFDDWRDSEIEVMDSIMATRGIEPKVVGANYKNMPKDRFIEAKEKEKKVAKRENKADERDSKLLSQINKANEDINEKRESLKRYEEDLKKKDKRQTAKGRSLNSKEDRLNNKEELLNSKELNLKEEDEKQALRGQKMDDRELLLNELDNTLKDEGEALKEGQEALQDDQEALQDDQEGFDEYVKLMNGLFKEQVEKTITDKTGLKALMQQVHTLASDRLEDLKDKLSDKIELTTADIEKLKDMKTDVDDLTAEDINDLVEDDSQQM